jgi:hypothetical protein
MEPSQNSQNIIKKRVWYILAFLVLISLVFFVVTYIRNPPQSQKKIEQTIQQLAVKKPYHGSIPVLVLSGDNMQAMGIQYGKTLKPQLKEVLAILTDYYITQKHLTYNQLDAQANLLYNRYPEQFQLFLQGAVTGSGLSLSDIKILNAMETLGSLLAKPQAACAFVSVPGSKTITGSSLIGRNYDYSAPFDQLAKYLTVTVLKQPNKIPTAFISIAGEVYCPTCINAKGIFMELNNGMPSGGTKVDTSAKTMLVNMLTALQNYDSLDQISEYLKSMTPDFSLIVNAAHKGYLLSIEFSTDKKLKTKRYSPSGEQNFISTNYFLDTSWGNRLPKPTDENTWLGVSRRHNLLQLVNNSSQLDIAKFQQLMDTDITKGGGRWKNTIYQVIFDESDLSLYIKILGDKTTTWQQIPLNDFF